MKQSPCSILLCSFSKEEGWRVRAESKSESTKVAIFKFGAIKLLKVPTVSRVRPGSFCNPRTIVKAFTWSA